MPGIRDLLGHVGGVDFGPVDPIREPHTPPTALDLDLSHLTPPVPNHLQEAIVGR